jgi:hypothetical protein
MPIVPSLAASAPTSLPIARAGGTYPAKPLKRILAGLLTFESDRSPGIGQPLTGALAGGDGESRLDLGCVAAHGTFSCDEAGCFTIVPQGKPAMALLLELIARLQSIATVSMIDVRAYAKWLAE